MVNLRRRVVDALPDGLTNRLRRGRPPGRAFVPEEDETMLVSYPRSGNTWLRFLLANLKEPDTNFLNLEDRIPDIYVSRTRAIRSLQTPRIIKSHEPFNLKYVRVIYLVRDPRDVAVSYLRYLMRVGSLASNSSLDDFVRTFVDSGGMDDTFGSWGDHVSGWLDRDRDPNFMLVQYEHLLANTRSTISSIAEFCGIRVEDESVIAAIEASSPETMRRLERLQAARSSSLHFTNSEIPFVGPARQGVGRASLSAEAELLLSNRWGGLMDRLGYH